ncbi:helix-turn-helix transcriptional regulator [Nonomuraea endophytica]|uniref:helix-turn-helix transcriptional regulator n=1 Tax=Nonomuraea endophytica TaxID=714136 RepID=UPI0037C5DBDF
MANTSGRMLRLLSLLQTHRHWPGTDLAARLAVSERTLRRDIDRLRELGYPVDAARGVDGGYQLRSGTAMPPLLLDDDEAVAIAVGLQAAADGAVAGAEETSVQALAKIVQVMPPRLRHRVDALARYTVRPFTSTGPQADPATLTTLAQSCRDTERLHFTYRPGLASRSEGAPSRSGGPMSPAGGPVSHSGDPASHSGDPASRSGGPASSSGSPAFPSVPGGGERRHVEPHRLVSVRRKWYLLAWDLDRHDWRTFRVDRMEAPAATGVPFRPREVPGGDPAAFVRDRFTSQPTAWEVVVIAQTSLEHAQRVVAATGGVVEPIDDATCRLVMHVDEFDWPVLILTALAAEFEVVKPPEFRAYLGETAARLARGVKRS